MEKKNADGETGKNCVKLFLPWPPSMNHVWRTITLAGGRRRTVLSKKARDYRLAVRSLLLASGIKGAPLSGALEVRAVYRPPDKRRRDLDNFDKAVFDALTHASFWRDDSQVRRQVKEFGEPVKLGRVEIEVRRLTE